MRRKKGANRAQRGAGIVVTCSLSSAAIILSAAVLIDAEIPGVIPWAWIPAGACILAGLLWAVLVGRAQRGNNGARRF